MTALDLLRARFPESEGWRSHSITHPEHIPTPNFDALVRCVAGPPESPFECTIQAWGDTEEVAATALISAWDAATHAEKVRELVRALEKLSCLGNGDRPGNSDGNRIAQAALAALPEHWKEVPRGK